MSDVKIISFVHMRDSLEHRRRCLRLVIEGRRFELTLDEARHIRDSLDNAIAFEECAEELREKIKDARDKADTGEILRALAEQKGME